MDKDRVWRVLCVASIAALCALALGIYHFFGTKSQETGSEIGRRVVVIDPGHGGEDGGAVAGDGTVESGINLSIAKRLDFLLTFLGEETLMLREEDISLHSSEAKTIREKKVSDIHNRVDTINALSDPVVISIHQNFFPSSKYHGAHVFYANGALSQDWAEKTQKNLAACVDPENQRVAAPVAKDIYLLNHIRCPAILVECGFLSNLEERERLKTPEYQRALAAIVAGSYIESIQKEGSGEYGSQSEESFLLHAVRK